MKTGLLVGCMGVIGFVSVNMPAIAQSDTAYQAGLRIAAQRSISNAECYATVFAKHARSVESANGRRNWQLQSLPSYNSELQEVCNIDVRATVPVQPPRPPTTYDLAKRKGYTDEQARCHARVDASYANRTAPGSSGKFTAFDSAENAKYRQELWNSCQVSR